MAIEYRSKPDAISTLIKETGIRYVGWDLDGTLVNTERLHREICRAAFQEISGLQVSEREFREARFRSAFGLPGEETSLHLAKTLKAIDPKGFNHALKFALSRGLVGDAVGTVGDAITKLRDEIFDFYINNVTVGRSPQPGNVLVLNLTQPASPFTPVELARVEALKNVQVNTYRHIVDVLDSFERHSIAQGICTSSGSRFALPLIKAFGLMNRFGAFVTADIIPDGLHKPDPYPWRVLRASLGKGGAPFNPSEPITDMLFIENSAGGSLSAIRAGFGPTYVVADNISGTVGKLNSKLVKAKENGPGYDIHGRAIFVNDLSPLVAPTITGIEGV